MPRGPRREFVYKKELDELASVNAEMVRSNYQEALHSFRARVLGKMAASELDLGVGLAWQMYKFDDEPDGAVRLDSGRDLTLLASSVPRDAGDGEQNAPYIRLIESERIECDDGIEFFTYDVTVDDDGDAQYFVDSFPVRQQVPRHMAKVPICMYSEQTGIVSANLSHFTYMGGLQGGGTGPILPFGHYECQSDKLDALDMAINMFCKIEPLASVHEGVIPR